MNDERRNDATYGARLFTIRERKWRHFLLLGWTDGREVLHRDTTKKAESEAIMDRGAVFFTT